MAVGAVVVIKLAKKSYFGCIVVNNKNGICLYDGDEVIITIIIMIIIIIIIINYCY